MVIRYYILKEEIDVLQGKVKFSAVLALPEAGAGKTDA
jgi:hypothetical protein